MPEEEITLTQPEPTLEPPPTSSVVEQLVAEWDEPEVTATSESKRNRLLFSIGSLLAVGVLVWIGIWRKDFTYYLAGAGALAAALALFSQRKAEANHLHISVTTQRLQVGKRVFPLAELAGFWFEDSKLGLVINVEPQKAAMLPISFFYLNSNQEEARSTLLTVLPEVEPRRASFGDRVNRLFNL